MRYFLSEIYPQIRREEPAVTLTITGSTAGVDLLALALDVAPPAGMDPFARAPRAHAGSQSSSTTSMDLSALPLDGSVHLSGYVADIRPLVAAASVCIVPVRQGGGTRLKVLEAMALGTPVVSTAKGTEGLAVTPEQDILVADDPAEFAGQVLRVLREPGLRAHLAANARHLVEQHYDWQSIGQRFVELVETPVGERSLS
jgi:glycosyltransferase involved in cell wall biosynthesis